MTDEHLTPQELGTVWSAVFVTEFIMLFIINAFTIIAFLRKRHLRKPTTYLIINLAVADLLVGAVTGPLQRYASDIKAESKHGFSWRVFIVITLNYIFPASSLLYLSIISLERHLMLSFFLSIIVPLHIC